MCLRHPNRVQLNASAAVERLKQCLNKIIMCIAKYYTDPPTSYYNSHRNDCKHRCTILSRADYVNVSLSKLGAGDLNDFRVKYNSQHALSRIIMIHHYIFIKGLRI